MIISASRRTDIPSYFSDWFMGRLKEGFVYVRNPMNTRQVSKITLNPDVVDGIVLWTKNPLPILEKLRALSGYTHYFQFTLTSYQSDVEGNLPSKKDILIPAFQRLSDLIGSERVIWRYDPILLNDKYGLAWHIQYFEKIAKRLHPYTRRCTISFIDYYRKTANNMKLLNLKGIEEEDKHTLAQALARIAHSYGLAMDTCAEDIDLREYGIHHAHCVDGMLLEKLSGHSLKISKDKSQRDECGCMESIDIGQYNTCQNGCRYCYANHSAKAAIANVLAHDPLSPLMCGALEDGDEIFERKVASNNVTPAERLF